MYHISHDKRSIQSSEYIFEALAQLMNEKSYSNITVKELVERAKLGRATFYRNFETIDDVLHWKCDESFAGLYVYVLEYYKTQEGSAQGRRPVFIKPFLRYWYVKSTIIELLIHANRIDILNNAFQQLFERLFVIIDSTHQVIRNHFDYFVAIRQGVAVNILIQWMRNGKNIAPDDLAELMMQQLRESVSYNLIL